MARRCTLRLAVPSDADALTRIAIASKRHWGYEEELIQMWRSGLTISPGDLLGSVCWVAEVEGETAGFTLLKSAQTVAEIEHLWVSPDFMGRGVGRALFGAAFQEAQRLRCRQLRVESDPHATGFYQRMGGRISGEVPSTPAPRVLPVLVFDVAGDEIPDRPS